MTLFGFIAGLFNDGCSHLEFDQCQDSCISPEPYLYAKLKADELLTSAPDTYEQNVPIQIELDILETCWKTEGRSLFSLGPASAAPGRGMSLQLWV